MSIIEKIVPGIRSSYQKMIPATKDVELPSSASLHCAPLMLLQRAPDMPAAVLTWKMEKSLNGYVFLQPLSAPTLWSNDKSLESIDFNKRTVVYASSSQLPYQLFAPDFMAWYLDLPNAPTIFLQKDIATAFFMKPTKSAGDYAQIGKELITLLIKSGGLE